MSDQETLEHIFKRLSRRAGREARPFYAKSTSHRPKDAWGSSDVRIFDNDQQIGSYKRNHPGWGDSTFEAFELSGRWDALYARDNTSTRIMSLPECKDIGGEEPHSAGFCPVEFFIPRYRILKSTSTDGRQFEHWYFESAAESNLYGLDSSYQAGPWQSLTTGFVAGCLWGDDSSWKLQTIDLSRAAEGIITRSERFGYVEIGVGLPLASAVQLYRSMPYSLRARIIRQEERDIETGALIDPYE
jgi:hypothetical protein